MVELTKAFLIYCPPHHEQYYRPYEPSFTGDSLRYLNDVTSNGSIITPNTLTNIAMEFVKPSTTPVAEVQIANGFSTPRLAFFLEFTTKNGSLYNTQKKEIVTGFTSHCGVDHNGNVDPQMVFFINSRQVIKTANIDVGHKGFNPHMVMDQNQGILPHTVNLPYVSMRPEDIVAQNHLQYNLAGMPIIDKRSDLSHNCLTTPRDSSIPSYFLGRILGGYQSSFQAGHGMDDSSTLFSDAISNVRSESLFTSDFIVELKGNDPRNHSSFTFGEINFAWPRRNDFWIKQLPKPNSTPFSYRDNTEHWRNTLPETDIAFNLSHALPALMSKLMLVEIHMDISNMTITGEPEVAVLGITGMFDGIIDQNKLQYFIRQIKNDIIQGIILRKVATFRIEIKANLLKDNQFSISLNGGLPVPFSAPMFCESYYSPLIGNRDNLCQLSTGVEQIVQHLGRMGALNSLVNQSIDPAFLESTDSFNCFKSEN